MDIDLARRDELPQEFTSAEATEIKAAINVPRANVTILNTVYSPVERQIGYWQEEISGVLKKKPLYQKTIIGTFDGTQNPSVNHGISNLEHIVDYNCMTTSKSEYNYAQRSIPFVFYADSSDNFDASINIYANSISFLLGDGFADQQETFRITIQYTKTSDSWEVVA